MRARYLQVVFFSVALFLDAESRARMCGICRKTLRVIFVVWFWHECYLWVYSLEVALLLKVCMSSFRDFDKTFASSRQFEGFVKVGWCSYVSGEVTSNWSQLLVRPGDLLVLDAIAAVWTKGTAKSMRDVVIAENAKVLKHTSGPVYCIAVALKMQRASCNWNSKQRICESCLSDHFSDTSADLCTVSLVWVDNLRSGFF